MRIGVAMLLIALLMACAGNGEDVGLADTPEVAPTCSFQIQQLSNLPDSKYKVVSGIRICNPGSTATKEISVFAPHEQIDNQKECNLFATTDTSVGWQIEVARNHITVVLSKQVVKNDVLLQQETLYDSIKVTYITHQSLN